MSPGSDGAVLPPVDGQSPSTEAPVGDLGIAVALDQFSGPMDLLLFLVRRTEIDVRDLPIAAIADQFAAWVAATAEIDLEQAGDFVVMAATLLEIKARLVAPPPEGTEVADDGEGDVDPRSGLIRKLLAYRAAKEAAFDLDRRDIERRLQHERGHREVVPDDPDELDSWELKDVDTGTMANLWFDLLRRIDGLGPRTVMVDDVPMGIRMAQVVEAMRQRGEGRLSELFETEHGKVGRVAIVMAVLECTRQRMLQLAQAEQYGEVRLRFLQEAERLLAAGDPGPPETLPKRQRRPPLVTWSSRPGAADAEVGDDQGADEESTIETDEQRFVRELEQDVGVERLLACAGDLEAGFIAWWEETYPGEPLPPGAVKPPPPPPPPQVVPIAPSEPAAVKPARFSKASPTVQVADVAPPAPTAPESVALMVPAGEASTGMPAPVAVPQTTDTASIAEQPVATMASVVHTLPEPESTPPVARSMPPQVMIVPIVSEAPHLEPMAVADQGADVVQTTAPVPIVSVALPIDLRDATPTFSVEALPVAESVPPLVAADIEPEHEPEPVLAVPPLMPVPPPTLVARPVDPVVVPAPAPAATLLLHDAAPVPPVAVNPPPPRPPPSPPPPPPTRTPTQPTPSATTTPKTLRPMPRKHPLTIVALTALYVLSVVAFVAWFQRPGDVLTMVSGPDNVVVPRDSELAWTLNLPVTADAQTPHPTITPDVPGTWSWRSANTMVFMATSPLPAGQTYTVEFPARLQAVGGFGFKSTAVPKVSVRTAPALQVTAAVASVPAFGPARIDLVLNRAPADPMPLLSCITVQPEVAVTTTFADGRLTLSGAFEPGSTYQVAVSKAMTCRADDGSGPWSMSVVVPQRTSGARLISGQRRDAPQIEAVGLDRLVVEAVGADGIVRRDTVEFSGPGDVRRAELPVWLVTSGRQQAQLCWSGGQTEVVFECQSLLLRPSDLLPAVLGHGIPVAMVR